MSITPQYDDTTDSAIELSLLQAKTMETVKQLVNEYKATYDHIFTRSEAILQRSLETGDTSAATIALIQMVKSMDLAWKNFSVVGMERQFECFLMDACKKLAITRSSGDALALMTDQLPLKANSLGDFMKKLPMLSLGGSLVAATPSQQRMASTAIVHSAFCPDVHSLYDVHHPAHTLYATDLDRGWDPVKDLTCSTLRFLQATILSEVHHDHVFYGTHVRCTVVGIMAKMGFNMADVESHAIAIDTQFFMRICADEELSFLVRETPKILSFPGKSWYKLMQAFIDSKQYSVFGSLHTKDAQRWVEEEGIKRHAREVYDILKDWKRSNICHPRYTILHALNYLQKKSVGTCEGTMSEMYAGTPLPINKLSLEMQTRFLSDLQQIPVYGDLIHSFVGSCDAEFLVVRAYPLQLRMTLVAHIKRMMWRMELLPKTPAVLCSSGVFTRDMFPPRADDAQALTGAFLKWLGCSPFTNEYQRTERISNVIEETIDDWFERGWQNATQICKEELIEEVTEETVRRACCSRLGGGNTEPLAERITRVAQLLVQQKQYTGDCYQPPDDFDPTEVLNQMLASKEGVFEHRQRALFNIAKMVDTNVGADSVSTALGESSLRPATVFFTELKQPS